MTIAAGNVSLGGTLTKSSASGTGLTTLSDLSVTGETSSDQLTATLTVNSAATPAATLTLQSSAFRQLVLSAPTTLNGQAGVPYSQSVALGNGSGSYTFSEGTLPAGLVLGSSTGLISGTPTAVGSFHVKVQVNDTVNLATASASFTLNISSPAITVSTVPSAFPALQVGVTPALSFSASWGHAGVYLQHQQRLTACRPVDE